MDEELKSEPTVSLDERYELPDSDGIMALRLRTKNYVTTRQLVPTKRHFRWRGREYMVAKDGSWRRTDRKKRK